MANSSFMMDYDVPETMFRSSGLWALLILGLPIIYLALSAASGKSSDEYGGPTPLPLLGNIATLWRVKEYPDEELPRLNRLWGAICALKIGSVPLIVLNSPRAAKELLNEVRFNCAQSYSSDCS